MAVYIELDEDPFVGAFNDESADFKSMDLRVRRPVRGIQLRRDQPAYITILDRNGNNIDLIDASAKEAVLGEGRVPRYTSFLLQGYSATRKEKSQIIQTFGEDFVFFYGEQPKVYTINGILMHTADFNWRNEFIYNYENHLRGTKLVEAGARAYIFQAGVMWEGYPLGFAHRENSAQPYHVNFSMEFLVTNETIVGDVGNVNFPNASSTGTGTKDRPWANNIIKSALRVGGIVSTGRAGFSAELANFVTTGGAGLLQDFKKNPKERAKIADNFDEFLGQKLEPIFSKIELAKAKVKMSIRRSIYLNKQFYLRSKFVLDASRRLEASEQSTLAKVFGTSFIMTSLAQATMADIQTIPSRTDFLPPV